MASTAARRTWSLKSFIDSLTLELDRLQDTLAVKGVNRRLTYTVKDLALDLQLFPEFDGEELRFSTARPGEDGAARISFQLGSITDRQIRETTTDPPSRDDVTLEVVDGLDSKTRKSLEKIGVTTVRDLERMEQKGVDVEKVSDDAIDYRRLAQMVQRARRRAEATTVRSASIVQEGGDTLLVIDGEHLGAARGLSRASSVGSGEEPSFPRAFLDGEEVPVRRATDTQLGVVVDEARLRPGGTTLQVALDPFAVLRMNLKP